MLGAQVHLCHCVYSWKHLVLQSRVVFSVCIVLQARHDTVDHSWLLPQKSQYESSSYGCI